MAASSTRREAFGSRAGFIPAAAGSAAFVLAFSLREAAAAVVAFFSG
jgi:SNF family Na+-dependent transporter